MRPLIITVYNFLPFYGETTVDLREVGAAVISGKNETGKSSYFIDSVLFVLFGHARKRQEGLIHDLADDMWVRLFFRHQNKYFVVQRSITRNKQQKLILYQVQAIDKVEDWEKGTDLTERLLTLTQEKLESIIGVSYELLLATSITQQEDINLFLKMQPAQREQVLIEMLSLDIWDKKKKKMSELIKQSEDAEQEYEQLDLELQLTIGQIEEITKNLTDSEVKLEPLLINQKDLQEQEEKEKQILERSSERTLLAQNVNTLKGSTEQLRLQLDSFKDVPKENAIKEAKDYSTVELKELGILCLEVDVQRIALKDRIKELTEKERYVRGLLNKQPQTALLNTVPCIGTQYHNQCALLEQGRSVKKEIDRYLAGLSRRFDNLQQVLSYFVKLQKENTEKEEFFQENNEKIFKQQAEHEQRIKDAERNTMQIADQKRIKLSLAEKEAELLMLQVQLDEVPEVSTKRLIEVQVNLKQVDSAIKDIEINQASLTKELELRQIHELNLKQKLVHVQSEKDKIGRYRTLHRAYSDIPTLLFTETIPQIEEYTNKILSKISTDKQVILRAYRDTKAKTQVKALDILGTTSTGSRDFENLSGSEKFRQSLALRVALARVNAELYNTEIGFFIVDEGFGSLDDSNIQLIKQTLRDIAKQFDLFVVITHVTELKDTFNTEIVVSSGGKGSRINIVQRTPSEEIILDA